MRFLLVLVVLGVFVGLVGIRLRTEVPPTPVVTPSPSARAFQPSQHAQGLSGMTGFLRDVDDSGFRLVWEFYTLKPDPFDPATSGRTWAGAGFRGIEIRTRQLQAARTPAERLGHMLDLARLYLYEGEPAKAKVWLTRARELVEPATSPVHDKLENVVFLQAVTALRTAETQNCVQAHCQSSCILPIDRAAVHGKTAGSREAIERLEECLKFRPESYGERWLLNIAYMTLGRYPQDVPKRFLIPPETFRSKLDVGRFVDVAPRLGVNRVDISGSAVMDDFDNDGLLDIVQSCFAPDSTLAFYKNKGDGTFEDRSQPSRIAGESAGGAFRISQTDFDNDGWLDVFASRTAFGGEVRQALLRNNRDGTFADVTRAAKLHFPINSVFACWADYDNDGWLDVFVGAHTERERSRLYRNRGDGTFEEGAIRAGVLNIGALCKGGAWGDFDRDGWPDLYVAYWPDRPHLYHNNRNGTFTDVAEQMGIDRPRFGFSTWFFDYDNDGWPDIFAAAYQGDLDEAVKSLLGLPHSIEDLRVWRNVEGKRFEDVTGRLGLEQAPVIMGSNHVDIDNDGFLDIYLGTGAPPYSMLLPNRMFKNIDGKRFEDVSFSSGTAHLQKGHGISAGDWNRDGQVDIFAQMGGAVPGDPFANALFHNPGHPNHHWLTVKLAGVKTNRAALGARITVKLAGGRAIHRTIDPGSSFGANTLLQTIGTGTATTVESLEVVWPTSQTTQRFSGIACDQAIQITEFEKDYKKLGWTPVPFKP